MFIVWLFSGLVSVALVLGVRDLTAYRSAALPVAVLFFLGFLYFTLGSAETKRK
jgi:hypothetical protein